MKNTENKNHPYNACKASTSCTAHNSCFASAKQSSLFLPLRRLAGYGGQEGKTSPYNACEASASCTGGALHICRRQMLHTFVCLTRRGVQDTKCFIRSTFTLIELLVVIAIIAILAAMLMPALSQARESGRKSVCTSNQAQLIKAIHNYASDNGDYLPAYSHAKKNASEENAKRRWTYTVVSYLGYTPSDELRLPKIFLCPSFTAIPDAGSRTVTDPYAMSSYIWNNFAGYNIPGDATSGRPDPKHPYLKMNKAKLPSKFVVAAEQGIARYNYLAALGGDAGSRMFNWTGTTAKFIDFAAHVRDSNYMCLAGNITAMRLPESARNDNGSGKDEEYYLQMFRPY